MLFLKGERRAYVAVKHERQEKDEEAAPTPPTKEKKGHESDREQTSPERDRERRASDKPPARRESLLDSLCSVENVAKSLGDFVLPQQGAVTNIYLNSTRKPPALQANNVSTAPSKRSVAPPERKG
jgi:hypothetical protein